MKNARRANVLNENKFSMHQCQYTHNNTYKHARTINVVILCSIIYRIKDNDWNDNLYTKKLRCKIEAFKTFFFLNILMVVNSSFVIRSDSEIKNQIWDKFF